jgi:hypothetical protein
MALNASETVKIFRPVSQAADDDAADIRVDKS